MKKIITINWTGYYSCEEVIEKACKGGSAKDNYSGEDYGLYQIYGPHILHSEEALLYVGQTVEQTFSGRMRQHFNDWIFGEPGLRIYLGRIENEANDESWKLAVNIAEAILVYKYVPNYNSCLKQQEPSLYEFSNVQLVHKGELGRLQANDLAPEDYEYKMPGRHPNS